GFGHPDLYSKHLLVEPRCETICVLDWQRSRLRRFVGWRQRWLDLAALDATLADNLVTPRERLRCLRAYLQRCSRRPGESPVRLRQAVFRILSLEKRLRRQRRIREQHHLPLMIGTQSLIWRDGEALCLTPEFESALQGEAPDWLDLANLPAEPRNLQIQ